MAKTVLNETLNKFDPETQEQPEVSQDQDAQEYYKNYDPAKDNKDLYDTTRKPQRQYAIIRFSGKTRKIDPDTVSVGINGKKYRMQRNEFVPVPKEVIDVLRDAKEPVAEPDEHNVQGNMIRRRKVVSFTPRFPFELLGWISKKDYEALRKIAMKRSLTEKEVYEVL